jgi:hypothetical protein
VTSPFRTTTWWPGTVTFTPRAAPTYIAVLANFSGGGELGVQVNSVWADFGGEGTLSVLVNSVFPQFESEGTLAAVATIGLANVTADFGGDGALTASVASQ